MVQANIKVFVYALSPVFANITGPRGWGLPHPHQVRLPGQWSGGVCMYWLVCFYFLRSRRAARMLGGDNMAEKGSGSVK